jgi:hypothetical protein
MKAATRGTLRTLVHEDNSPVTTVIRARVAQPPRDRGGKTYVTLIVNRDEHALVYEVDTVIHTHQPKIEYSPVLSGGTRLVVKIARTALADPGIQQGDCVEAHLKLGNFGSFGYCWIASNIFKCVT